MIYILLIIGCGIGVYLLRLWRLENRPDRIPVLNYHRIVLDKDIALCKKESYVVPESAFREQMQYLKKHGFTTIDLDDFLHYREHREELPARPVIITFDDGYENNYLHAYPILREHGFKAVIYSVSDPGADFFSGFEIPERLLTPGQMKELSDNGISIQGHTATHPHLKDLSDADIHRELSVCKSALEAVTGRPVRHMAIPYGSYDRRLFPIARQVGYKTLEVPGRGTINPDTDPYHLGRMAVHGGTSMAEFEKILFSPGYAVIGRLYAAAHLALRRFMGKAIEDRIKNLCAAFGLDNPVRLMKVAAGIIALVAGLLICFFLFLAAAESSNFSGRL